MAIDHPEHSRGWRRIKALIFLLIGLSALGWLVYDQRRAGVRRGLTSTGTLVQARIKEMNSQRGGNVLTLCYEFSAGGSPYEIRDRKVADFDGLEAKGLIDVWYDPADPRSCVTRNELRHPRYGATPFLFAGLIVLVMAAAALATRRVVQPARSLDGVE